MEYEVSVAIEKVIYVKVKADSEEEAIEKAKEKVMGSKEDFASIMDACVNAKK